MMDEFIINENNFIILLLKKNKNTKIDITPNINELFTFKQRAVIVLYKI